MAYYIINHTSVVSKHTNAHTAGPSLTSDLYLVFKQK